MKKKIYILTFFLLLSGLIFSQSTMNSTSISSSFSPVEIEAYQESADKKIEDFYSYLNLLSDEKISEKTKNEIRENIFLLFKNNRIEVIGFSSEKNKKLSLTDFLKNVENQKMKFKLKDKTESIPEIFDNYWISEYSLEIESSQEKSVRKITQKIYFNPKNKKFGSNTKEVWEIKLGEIE